MMEKVIPTEKQFNDILNKKIYRYLYNLLDIYSYNSPMKNVINLNIIKNNMTKEEHIRIVKKLIDQGNKIYKEDLDYHIDYLREIIYPIAENVDNISIKELYKGDYDDILRISLYKVDKPKIETLNIAIKIKEYEAVKLLLEEVEPNRDSYFLADKTVLDILP